MLYATMALYPSQIFCLPSLRAAATPAPAMSVSFDADTMFSGSVAPRRRRRFLASQPSSATVFSTLPVSKSETPLLWRLFLIPSLLLSLQSTSLLSKLPTQQENPLFPSLQRLFLSTQQEEEAARDLQADQDGGGGGGDGEPVLRPHPRLAVLLRSFSPDIDTSRH